MLRPSMSALANPDYRIQIVIEDGTLNQGLGARVAAVIKANGFTDVSVVEKTDQGYYPTSSISARSQDLSTTYLIAGLVGGWVTGHFYRQHCRCSSMSP